MTQNEIKQVLELHAAWLGNREGGVRANLSGANLSRANLSRANLSGANLSGANLYRAYLSGANLSRADLSGTDLSRADLSGTDLSRADLSGTDLYRANLYRANLSRADLSGADLSGANLSGAKDLPILQSLRTSIVPQVGQFVGWKKCKNGVIAKLMIGKKARRSNATSRKCRAEYVKVLEIIGAEFGVSIYDEKTEYRVGQIVRCDKWNEDRWVECGGGIHFYLSKEEAEVHE